jgi:hypothetical protein
VVHLEPQAGEAFGELAVFASDAGTPPDPRSTSRVFQGKPCFGLQELQSGSDRSVVFQLSLFRGRKGVRARLGGEFISTIQVSA